jgi:hypothetical protein
MKLRIGSTPDLTVANVELATALAAANGQAFAHTASLADLTAAALDAEQQLAELRLPKSRRPGARASYLSGGRVPSSYRYPRLVTHALLERDTRGWYVTALTTLTVWPSQAGRVTVTLPAGADEYLVAKLRNLYVSTAFPTSA